MPLFYHPGPRGLYLKSMIILGIESSCDETAASVVANGHTVLSNVVNSQVDIHAEYGGVVPEVAARSHIEVINPVIRQAMREANVMWDDIDAIAVAYAPGLIGSRLVGVLAARTLAELHDKPLYPVHHVEGHIYANFITSGMDGLPSKQPEFPMLALAVSGLHSQLVLFEGHGDYRLLGETLDDAVGEAFDKVARMLGLPYPGGPAISRLAESGDPLAYPLPKAKLNSPYDFSFSGLKTAVLRAIQRDVGVDHTFPSHSLPERLNDVQRANFAASFQYTAVKTLVDATMTAVNEYAPKSIVIAGGAAANQELRTQLAGQLSHPIEYVPMSLCTDNAAMIAALGFYRAQSVPPTSVDDTTVVPSLSMNASLWSVGEASAPNA